MKTRHTPFQQAFQTKFIQVGEERVRMSRRKWGFMKEVTKSLHLKQVSVVQRWLEGYMPRLPHLLKIYERWGITPNEMLGIEPNPNPKPDMELRLKLFFFLVENCPEEKLSEWLRDIGQDIQGTAEEKRARLRQSPKYVNTPVKEFREGTMARLNVFSSESLADLCKVLDIDSGGEGDKRYRRIMREIGYREGWLAKLRRPFADATFTLTTVRPYVEWYPIIERGSNERDFYPAFAEEMKEIFGSKFVHEQFPIAYGSTLKVDFHLGQPGREGVGVEFKMLTNNSEIQRALGQVDQYKERYKENLLVVLFPDSLDKGNKAQTIDYFGKMLSAKGITVLVK